MKENSNLACDHIEPCNIEQSERHNRRDPEYIASLDPRTIYVRLELTHNNNVYVAPDVEGKTLQDVYQVRQTRCYQHRACGSVARLAC